MSEATTTANNLVLATADAGVAVFIGVFPTIQVAWATSDLPLFTPASAPILANAGAQSTASASSSATASSRVHAHSSAISTAAQAGIGIGTAVFALVLLVIGGLLLWRRRRRHIATTKGHGSPAEMPGHEMDLKRSRFRYAELGHEGVVSELAVDNKSPAVNHGRQSVWHEMEGDFTPVEVRGHAPSIGVRFPKVDEKDGVES
ncbi:hypothetical protein LTR78_008147 [Recurvomyces mirabilis]|uniref:Uncharacterized protein n=1 Tax=Recurvomyces mirabilis TaxID=574656 RepID=A0AAE0WIZ9_9PEZI|nr:hypothetical protein LTR78_008147 [Recurvomyces mirabilis]